MKMKVQARNSRSLEVLAEIDVPFSVSLTNDGFDIRNERGFTFTQLGTGCYVEFGLVKPNGAFIPIEINYTDGSNVHYAYHNQSVAVRNPGVSLPFGQTKPGHDTYKGSMELA